MLSSSVAASRRLVGSRCIVTSLKSSYVEKLHSMPPKRQRAAAAEENVGDVKRAARRSRTSTADEAVVQAAKSQPGTPSRAKKAVVSVEETTSAPTKSPKKKNSKKDADEEANGESESLSAPVPRSKTNYATAEGIPRNMTVPDPLVLDQVPKPNGTTRIASWNIVSLKSSMGKGLIRYIEAESADVLVLTETKCNDVPMVQALTAIYPHQTWGIGKTKGYAGVALLSKVKPLRVSTGFLGGDPEHKGRLVTAEFERYIVCGTYVVNAGEGLKSMSTKMAWNEKFASHLAECDKRKPAIWTGDLNVVLDARDLSKASDKWNKSPGYTATECNFHRRMLAGTAVDGAQEYVDIWRERNPDAIGHFTFYGFRGMCRTKGIGWRLDSFIVPKRVQDEVVNVGIRHSVYGASDHVPIFMDIKGTL